MESQHEIEQRALATQAAAQAAGLIAAYGEQAFAAAMAQLAYARLLDDVGLTRLAQEVCDVVRRGSATDI